MQLAILAYPPYRAGLGADKVSLEVPAGATLREVLRLLAQRSREFGPYAEARRDEWLWGQLLVHSRGEMVRLDDVLTDGDVLELLPPIAGGAG
ncbi:MAG: MoaD/ThiS family protein [Chloroflexota bacterium]|nr:MoaD/ThiS family protein [Chloroflexota bacterium]